MSDFYIGFSTPRSWFKPLSWLIYWVEGIPFSHCYVRIPSKTYFRDVVYQAKGMTVHFMGSKRFIKTQKVVCEYHIKLSEEQKIRLMQFCMDEAGEGYGVMQLIGIGLVRLIALFGTKVKNPFHDGMICSELCAYIVTEILGEKLDDDIDTIGPRGVFEVVSRIGRRSDAAADIAPAAQAS